MPKFIKAPPRTPEQIAEEIAFRERYAHRPSIETLLLSGDIVPDEFGQYMFALGRVREKAGMTLEAMAAKCGLEPGALARLETGRGGDPTLDTLRRCADALGKQVVILVEDMPEGRRRHLADRAKAGTPVAETT